MAKLLYGSICLSRIPRELIQDVTCKDGQVRKFLNIKIVERKEKSQFGDTHFVSCEPTKDKRKEGVNYIIGDIKTWEDNQQQAQQPQGQQAANDDLPF